MKRRKEAQPCEMNALNWTRTTSALSITLWILQFAVIISHISLITIWIGFLGTQSSVESMP